MNANEITPKAKARLNNSKNQQVHPPASAVWNSAFCIRVVSVVFRNGQPLASRPRAVGGRFAERGSAGCQLLVGPPAFWDVFDAHRLPFLIRILVWLIVFLFWFRTIFKLLGLFEKGILFTAETVRCLQILGGIYILKFLAPIDALCAYVSGQPNVNQGHGRSVCGFAYHFHRLAD